MASQKLIKLAARKRVGDSSGYEKVKAEIGMMRIEGQEPYFTVTGSAYERESDRKPSASGTLHDVLANWYPEYAHLFRWHLVSQSGLPIHYEANAIYWLEYILGVSRWPAHSYTTDPIEAFKHTIVFGAVAGDQEALDAILARFEQAKAVPNLGQASLYAASNEAVSAVRAWLAKRLPELREAFMADMLAAGVSFFESEDEVHCG